MNILQEITKSNTNIVDVEIFDTPDGETCVSFTVGNSYGEIFLTKTQLEKLLNLIK